MFASLLAVAAATCPVERAQYVLRDRPDVTATFHPAVVNRDWPGGVALALRFAESGRTYWALPWNGGTDRRRHVRFVRAPGDKWPADMRLEDHDTDLMTTDEQYRFDAEVPRAGHRAPAHLLLPWVSGVLWHATVDRRRDGMPLAFFDRAACGARANAAAVLTLPAVP